MSPVASQFSCQINPVNELYRVYTGSFIYFNSSYKLSSRNGAGRCWSQYRDNDVAISFIETTMAYLVILLVDFTSWS